MAGTTEECLDLVKFVFLWRRRSSSSGSKERSQKTSVEKEKLKRDFFSKEAILWSVKLPQSRRLYLAGLQRVWFMHWVWFRGNVLPDQQWSKSR